MNGGAERRAAQLSALRRRRPDLADRIDVANDSHVEVAPSRSGLPTAQVHVAGRSLFLHSRYDPVHEARQFLDQAGMDGRLACALVGFGLGYHAELASERIAGSAPLLLFEPDLGVLRAAFSHRDLAPLLAAPKVHWFTDDDDPSLAGELIELADELAEGLCVLAPPASIERAAGTVERVRRRLAEAVDYARMARTTRSVQGQRSIANLIGNLRAYATAESIASWKDRWRGWPAIVVSAGPSLAKNRHLLPRAKGKALLVSVGTACKQLFALGAAPDLVVQIDHSDLCLRHFSGLSAVGETVLLADPTSNPAVLDQWPGRRAMIHDPFAEHLLGRLARSMASLVKGITVAHTAFHAARFLGADPILLVGQDLAFTDGLYYSGGAGLHELWRGELNRFLTVETKEWERLVRRKGELRTIAGPSGEPVYTDRQMLSYLQQFERDFAAAEATVLDCTEGGARKRGAAPMPLEEALGRFALRDFPREWLAAQSAEPPSPRRIAATIEASADRMSEFQNRLEAMKRVQSAVLASMDRGSPDPAALERLARLEREVQGRFLEEFRIALAYDGELAVRRDLTTRSIEGSGASGDERLRAEVERDRAYLAGLSVAAGEVEQLLREAKRLADQSPS